MLIRASKTQRPPRLDPYAQNIVYTVDDDGDPEPIKLPWNPPQVPLAELEPTKRPTQPDSGLWRTFVLSTVLAALLAAVIVWMALSFAPGPPSGTGTPSPYPPPPDAGMPVHVGGSPIPR